MNRKLAASIIIALIVVVFGTIAAGAGVAGQLGTTITVDVPSQTTTTSTTQPPAVIATTTLPPVATTTIPTPVATTTTTTTIATPIPAPAPPVVSVSRQTVTASSSPAPAPPAPASTPTFDQQCALDNAYLLAHAYPYGFIIECGGYAGGNAALTCVNGDPLCPATNEIIIADVYCWTAVENEASNSWVLEGLSDAPIDPYGEC